MSRPQPLAANQSLQWMVPQGWLTIITAASRTNYAQIITVRNSLYPRAKSFLRNEISKPSSPMVDVFNGNLSIHFAAQPQLATVDLKFRFSRQQIAKNSWQQLDDWKYESGAVQFLTFPKSFDTSNQNSDHITYVAFVENEPNNPDHPYDMIITIHFAKIGALGTAHSLQKGKYNLANVQGDVLPGLPKAIEYFYFFQIRDVKRFRQTIKSWVIPRITTAEKIITLGSKVPPSGLPVPGTAFVGFNIAFSASGLSELGLSESLQDEAFHRGQARDAIHLGDDCTEAGMPKWDTEFQQVIHGVFQITGHDDSKMLAFIDQLEAVFASPRSSIAKVLQFRANFRPPPEHPNEHFGYRDGISKPEIEGFTFDDKRPMRFTGSPVVDLGAIVMGYEGDEDRALRPSWATDGSFFVFRKLKSYVPEFNDFLAAEAPKLFPNLAPVKATALMGARMFGRWKSGTPIVLAPEEDNPAIASDNSRLNNFDYNMNDQKTCPFSAHTRKSFPRSDTANSKVHLFRRQGIPYGPELGTTEVHRTNQDRGLAFTAYQSSIERGFKFVQQSFNNPDFPPAKEVQPGYDPVMGSTGEKRKRIHRFASGATPTMQANKISFPVQFVEARGGEYFFVPSMATLANNIAV